MNTLYLITLFLSLFCLSPAKQNGDMLVARFEIYATGDRETVYWKSEVDKTFFDNDCVALFYLTQAEGICDPAEIMALQKLAKFYKEQREAIKEEEDLRKVSPIPQIF